MKSTEKRTLSFQETACREQNQNHSSCDQEAQALTTTPHCLIKKKSAYQYETECSFFCGLHQFINTLHVGWFTLYTLGWLILHNFNTCTCKYCLDN